MSRQNLLLLHGALGSKSQFFSWKTELEKDFYVHLLDFEGHGSRSIPDRPFRVPHFIENVVSYLTENEISNIDIFGYSMGGAVALLLAKSRPELVGRVFTFSSKFDWNPESAAKACRFLDPEQILKKAPQFAKELEERHYCPGWKNVLLLTKEMILDHGNEPPITYSDLKNIYKTVRMGLGDRDNKVALEETVQAYHELENSELLIMPSTPHSVEKIDVKRITDSIRDFFLRK